MKNLYLLTFLWTVLSARPGHAQLPPQQWANQYGGGNVDIPYAIKVTTDGGTIITGYTDSKNGDINPQPNREYWDLWVVKLNRCGAIEWEKYFGGSNEESGSDIVSPRDGR